MNENPVLAIVIPCYNEADILNITNEKLSELLNNLIAKGKISQNSYLVYVDDGSSDSTSEIIKSFKQQNNKTTGLKFSRNFGHQYAMYAGLTEFDADIYVTVDADLQDDISVIESMVDKYKEGFDTVYGVRNNRETDTFLKRTTADLYYKITKFAGMKTIPQHADFRLISKKITGELKKINESDLYLRGIIPSLGFNSTCIYYKREKRIGGKPKYTFFTSLLFAIDGITSFSVFPLRLICIAGILSFCFAILMSGYALYSYLIHRIVSGWTSLFISLYLLGGMILFSLGIIGEYIAKIYNETKKRQRFIIEERF